MSTQTAHSSPYAILLGAIGPATTYEIMDEELVQTFAIQGEARTLVVTAKLQCGDVVDADDWFGMQVKDAVRQAVIGERRINMTTVGMSWGDYTTTFNLISQRGKLSLSFNHVSDKDDRNTQLRIDDVSVICS